MDKTKIAAQVFAARQARGWSQDDLAAAAGTSQSTIDRIEKAQFKRRPSVLPDVLEALKVREPADAGASFDNQGNVKFTTRRNLLVGERNLPVFASAEGGGGALILSSEPVDYVLRPAPLARVKDGYGLIIVLESMVPEFRPGDTALVHPHLPPLKNHACVFYADDGNGVVRAVVKSFVSANATHWTVQQWNPARTIKLPRKEWGKCHRIVGKYSGR